MREKLQQHIRPLLARDRHEEHRAATPLELLFDLVIVIAIAAAAHGLSHEISAGHIAIGIIQFTMAFFAVWWPWNLFTWFASSFDNDDAGYRINVMVMMFGAMLVAANLPSFFGEQKLVYGFMGYVIMRLAIAVLWWRAGGANSHLRITAARYTLGQIILQVGWAIVIFAFEPGSILFFIFFALAAVGELFVPWYAEKAANTHWHRHHIIERFGLLNIIVLGEVLLSSTIALETAFTDDLNASLLILALCGTIITFSLWWLYFCEEDHLETVEFKRTFIWGYGHFLVFASGPAVGAGLGVAIEAIAGEHGANGHPEIAAFAIALPIALYVVGLWLVRDRYILRNVDGSFLLFFAVLIALTGFLPYPPIPATILLIICLFVRLRSEKRSQGSEGV
ncbi:low temperature requirement protein A [Spirulina sp. 06S082]|uniref:low temperature requirement protein A n=1 Tax=Spirulina sp. 06S082 TaxID=3110248 RepID=UPI002B1F7982|nr:low temperature requirement protein A [Spirulina sp. 06S082]MEA5468151.1 low temperature requirement protein A [Spirulina sp. 06S082]